VPVGPRATPYRRVIEALDGVPMEPVRRTAAPRPRRLGMLGIIAHAITHGLKNFICIYVTTALGLVARTTTPCHVGHGGPTLQWSAQSLGIHL